MNDYQFRLFANNERADFRNFFAESTSQVPLEVQARREWWCFDNPNGGAFAVVASGREIAATCYLGGKNLQAGRNIASGFEIGETATEPAHQRKGLFSKLVKACVAHSAEHNRALVYGTPNSQSTPGYAKLGFTILEQPQSWMFLLPNLSYFTGVAWRWPGGRMREITAGDYIAQTVSFPRLNKSGEAYLDWRLARAPVAYRYFTGQTPRGQLYCAIKHASLGHRQTLVCAEHFLDGAGGGVIEIAPLLRGLTRRHYNPRQWAAMQVHAALPADRSALRLKTMGIVPHRILPICATPTAAEALPDIWFANFQLSDCDIG